MADAFRNNKTLPGGKIDNAVFEIDQETAVQNEKEFINVLVLMPMVLALHDCHPDDGIVHFA